MIKLIDWLRIVSGKQLEGGNQKLARDFAEDESQKPKRFRTLNISKYLYKNAFKAHKLI